MPGRAGTAGTRRNRGIHHLVLSLTRLLWTSTKKGCVAALFGLAKMSNLGMAAVQRLGMLRKVAFELLGGRAVLFGSLGILFQG